MKNATGQFVIQQHTNPDGVHWDLMLEMEDTLWTWRLNVPPAEITNEPIRSQRIGDHPKRFLTYEGPVQNNTGTVKIADKGTYQFIKQAEDILTLKINGVILNGTYTLSDSVIRS